MLSSDMSYPSLCALSCSSSDLLNTTCDLFSVYDVCFLFCISFILFFFFFSSRRRHTRSDRDWSSDVCSSDLMFTSCGWFFDDIAGLESLIVLRSAARAIELAGPGAAHLEAGLLERLALAPSNDAAVGTGRELYLSGVKAAPARGVPT